MHSRIATAAVAAVAASLVAGLGACGSSSNGASGGAPTAAGTSASATVPSATATATTSAPSGAGTASSTADTSGGFADGQLETIRAKVAAVFGNGVTASSPQFYQPTPDQKELAADFDSPATMKAVWGAGATGADRPMDCGMAKYQGVAIGAVQGSGGTATVPVALYQDAQVDGHEITVTVDSASGVIKSVTCGGAPSAADFPGIAPIAAYYGATATMDNAVLNDKTKSYFTPGFAAWQPAGANYNKLTCTQDVPDFWIVALTSATSGASAWDFAPGAQVRSIAEPNSPVGFTASMAVDVGSAEISRVTCAAKPPTADSAHPAQYAEALMNYYQLAADQTSLGVDAKAAIRPYFVSDAAFTAAWSGTGTVPLLCAKKVPGLVESATGTSPKTSGSRTTLSMVTWPDWHPDQPGQELSKFTLTLDASTLKIASITCTK